MSSRSAELLYLTRKTQRRRRLLYIVFYAVMAKIFGHSVPFEYRMNNSGISVAGFDLIVV